MGYLRFLPKKEKDGFSVEPYYESRLKGKNAISPTTQMFSKIGKHIRL